MAAPVLALALLALAACGGSGGNGGGGGGGGQQLPGSATNLVVEDWPQGTVGTISFADTTVDTGAEVAMFTASVNASRQLSYALTTPPANVLGSLVTVACRQVSPPQARFSFVTLRAQPAGGAAGLIAIADYVPPVQVGSSDAEIWYVDRDASFTGSCTGSGLTFNYNISLKQGWNFVIFRVTALSTSAATISVTGAQSLPASYKWYYYVPGAASAQRFQSLREGLLRR